MLWAVANDITAGTTPTTFAPDMICTRAQIVTFLYACFYTEEHIHAWGEWVVTTPATCAAEGVETRECSECEETETRTVAMLGHSFGEWEVTTPATCALEGVETRKCSECEETETRTVAMLEHSWSEWVVVSPSTCDVEGTEERSCATCTATETRPLPLAEHTWGEWTVQVPATETEEGVEINECTVCFATTTRPIPVIVYDPFEIVTQPESTEGYIGESASFVFGVTGGKAPYSYAWQVKLAGQSSFAFIDSTHTWATGFDADALTVSLDDATLDGAQFRCIVTDAKSQKLKSSIASLALLHEPPVIVAQPQDANSTLGGSVNFDVMLSGGLEPYTYCWQYIENGSDEFRDIDPISGWAEGVDSASLTVHVYSDQVLYGRRFRCVITDAAGNEVVTNVCAVFVSYLPLEITIQPTDVSVSATDSALFSAMVSGGVAPIGSKWQYKKGESGEWTDFVMSDKSWADDWLYWDLVIDVSAAGFENDYRFRCVFTDYVGETVITNEVKYTEFKNLSIKTQPEDVYVDPYESATFTVKVKDGLPSYFYQWYYRVDGMPMFTEITESDSWISGANSDTINVTLNPDDLENNVRFYCAVSDEYGDTVESNVVYPRARLRLTVEPGSVGVVAPLQQIYFDIAVDGGTAPYTYKWEYMYDLYPDTWIEESTETSEYKSTSHAMAFVGGMLEKNLMIRCTVTDAVGQSVSTKGTKLYNANTLQPLTINDRSPDYTNIDPGETAYFWVHPAGGIEPYDYQWQYRYNYQTQFNDLDGENGSTFDVLTTEYDRKYEVEYRCIVTDALGNEVISDVMGINFNLWFDYSDNTFAVSEGTTRILYADPKGGTSPLSYKWEVYSTIENMWFPLSAILLSDVTANNAALTVKVSKVVAKYYPKFRCIVTDADGNSAYTPERGFILNNPAFITDLPETYNVEKTGDRVTLKVTLNEYAKTPIKYSVEYTNDNYSGWATIDIKSGQGVSYETSYAVGTSDRDNNTRYRIVAVDADGRTVTSKEMAVIFPIRVVSYTKDRPLDVGNSTTFTVSVANGRSPYSYEWYYATESDGEYKKCIDSTEPFTGEKTSTLSVTSIKDYMKSYSVKCVITDVDGKTVESTAAVFTVMPLKITSQPVSVVASKGSYFTFKGLKASGGDGELSYKWQYAQNRSPKESDFSNCFLAPAYFTNHDTNELTVFFNTGFEKGTFRCMISDGAGNVVYSDYVYVNLP